MLEFPIMLPFASKVWKVRSAVLVSGGLMMVVRKTAPPVLRKAKLVVSIVFLVAL